MVRAFLVRAASVLGIGVVLVAGWTVNRAIDRARRSNERLVHTRHVLGATESILGMMVEAETGVRGYLLSGNRRDLEALDRADRGISPALDELTTLTAENSQQQAQIQPPLREAASRALRTLHLLAAARPDGLTGETGLLDPQQAAMDDFRRSLRGIRLEANRVFVTRIDADRAAMSRLRWILVALGVTAVALLGWVIRLFARDASRERQVADALRQAKVDLEAQVSTRTAELRELAERLRSVIDSAVDGIIVIDTSGSIEAFNRGAERLFGYAASEVLGRNVSMLMPSPYREEHDGYVARYLATRQPHIIGIGRQVTAERRDGTTFPVHLSVGEMSIGGVTKFTGMLHDLSERTRLEQQLRASEARWRAVIESAVDGIIVIDADGRIEAFNPAAERLFGYAEREVMGQDFSVLMSSPQPEARDGDPESDVALGVWKAILTSREVTGFRKDGTTFPFHLAAGEMTVNGVPKYTAIVHDLAERVRFEQRLREQTTLARLGEMAAVIAHEVKNPLAGIRGAIQVIGARLPKETKDAGMLKEIVTRIDALNELMKDVLLFARPPHPRAFPVDVRALIAATADLLSGDPAFKSVRLTVEGSAPPILADPELLKIVVVNLLVNSAHAMPGGGTIRVSLAEMGDSCHMAFSDTGPGIPAEARDKLFTPFFTTKARGTGLGLSTAKRLVEAHHGRIAIAFPPEGGTTVTIQLPRQGVAAH